MVSFRSSPARLGRVCLAVGACALAVATRPAPLVAQDVSFKLTTILADLSAAVAQDSSTGPVTVASAAPRAVSSLPISVQHAMHGRMMRTDASGAVQVYILMSSVTLDTLQALTTAGVTIQIPDAAHHGVQATIPMSRLQAVAALPFVNFIRLPNYAHRHTGSVNTEGDAIIHSDIARQQFGVDGTGVKVAAISDGLKGVFATGCTSNCSGVAGGPISTGDLPTSVGTRSAFGVLQTSTGGITAQSFQSNGDLEGLPPAGCGFPGAGAEGTALLEIVHDVAPGAQLAFANADTDTAFNQAVNFLATTNDIVLDDLGFFDVPFDGTNLVSANTAVALNNNGNRIRSYVTAVGNNANSHYLGGYVDSGVEGSTITGVANTGHVHLFQSASDTTDVLGRGPQPYDLISLPQNGEVIVFLSWDDPAGASTNNYDLYLVSETSGTAVARSIDRQTGSIDPTEFIDYVNTGASGFFHIVVQNVKNAAQTKNLNIVAFEPECATDGPRPLTSASTDLMNYNTATRSVEAESDAGGSPVSVVSVGAICSASAAAAAAFAGSPVAGASCNDTSHSTIEFYSGLGPTLDGRTKPDISGIDGVSITGAGQFELPFFGTSAATPHVAATAALALQAASCLQSGGNGALDPVTARTNLRNVVVSTANPRSAAPPDDVFGSGLVNAFAAVQKTLPILTGQPAILVNGNAPAGARLTPSQLGFTDPDQCPLTRVSWTGGCGVSPDSAMTCPFGTTNVSVSASNSGIAFSPASPLQVTVTSFAVSGTPGSATVTAGQSAAYQVSVAAQGGAFTNSVTLGCSGLPQGALCLFGPPVVTPGTNAATTTLTITTTAGNVAAMPFAAWRRVRPPFVIWTLAWITLALGVMVAWRRRLIVTRAHRLVWIVPSAVVAIAVVVAGIVAPACGSSTANGANSSGAVLLSATSLTFNSQTVGATSTPQGITISNTGSAALALNGLTASGDFAQTNTCPASLGAGASCTVTVTFSPTAAGSRTGQITIADSASNSPQTVSLTGTGVSANGPTPAGTYAITVDGSSGTLVKSGALTLVVH